MLNDDKKNLMDLDLIGLESYFAEQGEKSFRATQVLKWIYQQGVVDFDQMTNLSKSLQAKLNQISTIRLPSIRYQQASTDGTTKWLLQLADGNCIETVFIPEKERGTLCVSSQVGCVLNCTFCSTAQQGFNRNLTVAEIIGQVWVAAHALGQFELNQDRVISNVVMMGMGEPLLNFDNVVSAMGLMMHDNGFGLSKRRVTLSTSGVVPAIYELRKVSDVSLAVSLHACNDALRDVLVPINKKYPIADLLVACQDYVEGAQRRVVTFEYVMLDGINDDLVDAKALIKLLRPLPAKVNLIPFNPFPNTRYRCSSPEQIERFRNVLINGGLTTITRKTRGEDIDAACGQLAGKIQDRTQRSAKINRVTLGGVI